jgi:hypothetical protein
VPRWRNNRYIITIAVIGKGNMRREVENLAYRCFICCTSSSYNVSVANSSIADITVVWTWSSCKEHKKCIQYFCGKTVESDALESRGRDVRG